MKYLSFMLVGILFGVVAVQSEIISWYRIQEMFRFQSFHMYGVMASAVVVGAFLIQIIKRFGVSDLNGNAIEIQPKKKSLARYLLGGSLFGMGWALTGACPGPIYALIGSGNSVFLIVLLSALLGTLSYGALKKYLPH